MKQFSIILTIILTICFVQNAFAQKTLRLGFVKEFDFAGDSIWLANTKQKDQVNNKAIAVLGNGYERSGIISINGRDTELKIVKDYLPDKNFKVRRGGYQIWKGKNITVRLDYIFTWLCPPKDEQCEVYHYKGVLDINDSGRRRKVNILGFGGS